MREKVFKELQVAHNRPLLRIILKLCCKLIMSYVTVIRKRGEHEYKYIVFHL